MSTPKIDVLRKALREAAAAYAVEKANQVAEARMQPSQAFTARHQLVAFIDNERKRQKLSTHALNMKAGYSKSQLSNMRNRKQRLTIEAVEDYLNALGYGLAVAPIDQTNEQA